MPVANKSATPLSEEEVYKLKIFQMHLRRLSKFTRPLYKESSYTVEYTPKRSSLKTRNLATELRMAAIVNEIRSFMLNDDPSYFYAVASIASRYYQADTEKVKKIREWKKLWKAFGSQKTGMVINVGKDEILSNWGAVLDILTYGKFVHNVKEKHKTYSYAETDPMLSGHVALSFSSIAVNIDRFLRSFDQHFIIPIIENIND